MTTTDLRRSTVRSKVPEVTAFFWIVKAVTAALGESVSDFMVHAMSPVPAVLLGFAAFVVALAVQFRATRCSAWAYWTAVAMVGIFGTMAADVLHVGFGCRTPHRPSCS